MNVRGGKAKKVTKRKNGATVTFQHFDYQTQKLSGV